MSGEMPEKSSLDVVAGATMELMRSVGVESSSFNLSSWFAYLIKSKTGKVRVPRASHSHQWPLAMLS